MTRQLARRGLCRLDLLYRGAEPVAASIVLESAEALWLWRAAGAPGLGRGADPSSPGRRAGAPGRQAPDLRDVGHHAARESYTGSRVRRDGAGGRFRDNHEFIGAAEQPAVSRDRGLPVKGPLIPIRGLANSLGGFPRDSMLPTRIENSWPRCINRS